MMNPISPLDVGASNGLHYLGALGGGPRDASAVDGGTMGLRSASPVGLSDTVSLINLGNQISQLLQGIGGGVENNKTLLLLIGLLILLTLLEGSSKGGGSAAEALNGLGGAGSRGTYINFEASTTSITIEHTSMTMPASAIETMAASEANGQSQGHKIDLAA